MRFILDCWRHGWLPTFREMGDSMGIKSPNGIQSHVNALRHKQWIGKKVGHDGLVLGSKLLDLIDIENDITVTYETPGDISDYP